MGLTVYAVARSLAYAYTRPFWIDEFLTQAVCRQPNLEAVRKVLNQGMDGMPPLFYLIERAVASLFSNGEIGWRFLSVLGFACTLILVFVFVKTRNGRVPALISTSLLLMTPLFTYYAAEARPYTQLTACVAFALVCYQRAPAGLWVVGMFLGLFLASSLHYYAVFPWLCFFLAEIIVVCHNKQIRSKVWLALFLALVPLIVSLPLLLRMKQIWGLHFWSGLYPHSFGTTYAGFFEAGSKWTTAFAGTVSLVMIASFFPKIQQLRETNGLRTPIFEQALILGLVVLPVVGYVAAKITDGPYVDRYYLPSILGFTAVVGYLLGRAKRMNMIIAAIFVMLALGTQERAFWVMLRYGPALDDETSQIDALAKVARHDDLPIVVSDLHAYLNAWYYGQPVLRKRIVGLVDPVNAVVYSGTDTTDKIMNVFRSYEAVDVLDFAPFIEKHTVFLLYSNGAVEDWWPTRLLHDGYRLQLLARHGNHVMYLVKLEALDIGGFTKPRN
jgi:Dolichyl-phosphate-mannose-protein mannosyltransferase